MYTPRETLVPSLACSGYFPSVSFLFLFSQHYNVRVRNKPIHTPTRLRFAIQTGLLSSGCGRRGVFTDPARRVDAERICRPTRRIDDDANRLHPEIHGVTIVHKNTDETIVRDHVRRQIITATIIVICLFICLKNGTITVQVPLGMFVTL